MECKAPEFRQDCVKETRLDALAIKIMQQKKKAAACQIQSKQNLEKEKEAVKNLVAIIR